MTLAAEPNSGRVVSGAAAGAKSSTFAGGAACINRDTTVGKSTTPVTVTGGDTDLGSYVVRFTKARDISRCIYVATIGLCGSVGVEEPGFISTVRRVSDPKAVYVETRDTAGELADRGFHLIVRCR